MTSSKLTIAKYPRMMLPLFFLFLYVKSKSILINMLQAPVFCKKTKISSQISGLFRGNGWK
jgi:hypothetical protein